MDEAGFWNSEGSQEPLATSHDFRREKKGEKGFGGKNFICFVGVIELNFKFVGVNGLEGCFARCGRRETRKARGMQFPASRV